MTRIISIEGNIGSGKSSLVTRIQDYNKTNPSSLNICFLQEPVDIWNTITDINGKNIIECYYADQKSYAFSFQMMAYISRIHTIKEALKKNYDIIITERCVHTDKNVFAKMLYDEGKINHIEYKIYELWFNEFLSELPPIEIIYLKTSPNIASTRVIKRARQGESIPLEYLSNCDKYHNDWLNSYDNIVVFDGDTDINNVVNTYWSELINIIYSNQNIASDVNDMEIDEANVVKHVLTFDGASRGNPGQCGIGFVIWKNNEIIFSDNQYVSVSNTNNYAEYQALDIGLTKCVELKINYLEVRGDSELVIKQVNGQYAIKSENLIPTYRRVMSTSKLINRISFYHIPREENKEADRLANLILDNL